MPLNLRSIGGAGDQPAHTQPIARNLAVLTLAALLLLIILRHFFGNVRVDVGTK